MATIKAHLKRMTSEKEKVISKISREYFLKKIKPYLETTSFELELNGLNKKVPFEKGHL